jgi:hypothetical protein
MQSISPLLQSIRQCDKAEKYIAIKMMTIIRIMMQIPQQHHLAGLCGGFCCVFGVVFAPKDVVFCAGVAW